MESREYVWDDVERTDFLKVMTFDPSAQLDYEGGSNNNTPS